ncbi:MAG: response regulator [Candidatus Obscuribacter sp.]|nr:response regulator [Candidatus Obscuribacter sp.]MBK9282065.1 response regulator [Candidatus Obscuribacter sp.]
MTDKAILGADLISGLISTLGKQVVSLKLQLASLQAHLSSSSGLEKSVKSLLPERGHLDLGQVPGLIMRLSKERSLGAALSGDDGQILMASPAFYSLTGLKLDDPSHSTVRFYREEAGVEKECENLPWILALPNLRGGGEATVLFGSRYLVRQPEQEGGERWLQFVFRPLTGDGGGCLIFVAEATEEVAGERQLAKQVALLHAQVENFNGPVQEFSRVLERVLAFSDFGETRTVLKTASESEVVGYEDSHLSFDLGESEAPAFTDAVAELGAPPEVFQELDLTGSPVDEILPPTPEIPEEVEVDVEPELQIGSLGGEPEEVVGETEVVESQSQPFEDSDLLEDEDSEGTADALSVVLDGELQGESGLWQEFSDFVKEPSPVALPDQEVVLSQFPEEEMLADDSQSQSEPVIEHSDFSPPPALVEEQSEPELELEPEPEPMPEAQPEPQPEPEAAVSLEKRALVVDDIPVNQKLLVHQLRKLGFKTDIANNGVEALDLFKKGYTIIFMDCDMPVMSGYEATAEIRRREVSLGSHVPIIAMTSYDRDTDKEKCLAAGMDDYLTKGVNEGTLSRVIETALSGALHSGHEGSADQVVQAQISETMTGGETAPFDADSIASTYSREELKDIMRSFLTAMESFVASMQKAIDDHDVEKVRQLSNSIKGPCASLGLKLMTRVASDIINYAQSADWPQVRLKYLKLKTVYLRSQNDLRKACPEVFEEAHHLIG